MKQTKTKNRCLVTCLTLIAMLMTSVGIKAQTVHIGLDNGSLLTGVATQGNDSGWEQGFSTLWRHEQLSLSMMASDRDKLEDSGEVGYPSNVYAKHSVVSHNDNDKQFCIIGGRRPSFIVVSLPKGYRITGYTIVLSNDLQGSNFGGRFSSINDNDEGSGSYGTMRLMAPIVELTEHIKVKMELVTMKIELKTLNRVPTGKETKLVLMVLKRGSILSPKL